MEKEEKQNIGEPHVKIFNTEVGSQWEREEKGENIKRRYHHYEHHHHRHTGSGIFGLAILFAGILLLLNNFGIVSKEVWNYIWPFWPVLLILIGIRIIFGFNRIVGFFVFILALFLFIGIIAYALIHVGSPLVNNFYLPQGYINFISQLK